MEGYAKLGFFMGEHPEYAILRLFAGLNAQNILYLQAELNLLEEKLRNYATEDRNSGHRLRGLYSVDWQLLADSIGPKAESGENRKQWETFLEIREKLKEYSKLLC